MLLLALATTSGWVRSLNSADVLLVSSYQLNSAIGLITLEWYPDSPVVAVPFEWYSSPVVFLGAEQPSGAAAYTDPFGGPAVPASQPILLDTIPDDLLVGLTGQPIAPSYRWSWRLWGITIGVRDVDGTHVCEFPYWMIPADPVFGLADPVEATSARCCKGNEISARRLTSSFLK